MSIYYDELSGEYFDSTTKIIEEACRKLNDTIPEDRRVGATWETKDQYKIVQKDLEGCIYNRFSHIEESIKEELIRYFFQQLGIEPSEEMLFQAYTAWFS